MDFLTKARGGNLHLHRQVQDVGAAAGQPDVVIKMEQEEGDAGAGFAGAQVGNGEDGPDQQDGFFDCQEGIHQPEELEEVTARARGNQLFSLSLY